MRGKVKAKMHIYMPNVRKVNFKKNGKAIKGLRMVILVCTIVKLQSFIKFLTLEKVVLKI